MRHPLAFAARPSLRSTLARACASVAGVALLVGACNADSGTTGDQSDLPEDTASGVGSVGSATGASSVGAGLGGGSASAGAQNATSTNGATNVGNTGTSSAGSGETGAGAGGTGATSGVASSGETTTVTTAASSGETVASVGSASSSNATTGAGGAGAGSGGSGAGTGGSTGSGGATGGPLPPSVTALFPKIGSTGVCLDAPLTITFAGAPSVGAAGTISIYAASNTKTAVDSINLAAASYSDSIGGQTRNLVRPVFIDGNSAVVYFHQHKLAANTTYYVTVSSGSFVDAQKNPMGTVTSTTGWTFTTGAAPTASATMTVDRTGTGPLCTVQGAFDAIAANNTTARTITVAAGNYHEILYLAGKKNLTLHGADRAATVIEYPNNNNLNNGTAARPLFYANGTTGLTIENLTVYNTTPQDGSQAEAVAVQADQVILRNANFKSLQDTLLLSGRVYVVTSYVEGNVDFVWGTGATYFDQCEIKTVGRAGAVVQSRNTNAGYGYVFVDSKLTSDPKITGQVLARIDATVYPYSHVAYVNCQMSSAIVAKGWTITPAGTTQTGNLRFWEYQSTDANGVLLNVSGRDPASKQLTAAQAAMMRDKATVLAGWNPQ